MSTPDHRRARRTIAHRVVVALCAVAVALGVNTAGAAAQDCVGGVVDAEVVAESLPGGAWSVTEVCIPQDTFFELNHEGYRLVLGLATVTYDDGHTGRLAVGTLKYSDDEALTIVGVEDSATELVKWAGTLGSYSASGTLATMSGDGIAIVPEEPASLRLSIDGVGTDLEPLIGPQEEAPVDPSEPIVDSTTVPPSTEEPLPPATSPPETSTTVAPTTTTTTTAAPATTDGADEAAGQ